MGINTSVFPSKPEKKYFEHLKSIWGDKYHIYPNLPFLSVLNCENILDLSVADAPRPIKLKKIDIERLKKTSIDYTICDSSDKPVLCIEFDGIQQGVNIGTKYFAGKNKNPWRNKIMNLKLKVAHGSAFPFFVMKSSQFEVFNNDDKLAVVDCVIGTVLSKNEMEKVFKERFNPKEIGMTEEQFNSLSRKKQYEEFEKWACGIEVVSYFNNSPIHKFAYELQEKLKVTTGYGPIEHPSLKFVRDRRKRSKLIKQINTIGYRAWVELPDGRTFNASVWVHDFNTSEFSPYAFLGELSSYLALKKAQKKIKK
jgi:hypothetical protein